MPITVVNIKTGADYDVFVGRPSKWGNPFPIKQGQTREQVIEKYRQHILGRKDLLDALPELFNKRLGCFCAPAKCHADVLKELAEEYQKRIEEFAI